MKVKVLHISQSLGGVETYLKEIIGNIDQQHTELKVITPYSASLIDFCTNNGVEHVTLEMSRGFNIVNDIKCIISLKKYIKKHNPHIVHLHSSKAGVLGRIAAKQCNKISVFTPNGVSYLSFTGIKRLFFLLAEVMVKRYTNHLLAVSYSEANRLIYEIGFKPEKVKVILNAISIIPENVSVNYDNEKDIIKIGTIARLTYQKNPLLLADIAHKVINGGYSFSNKVHFYILGAGMHDHLLNELNDRIKQYNLMDRFHVLQWSNSGSVNDYLNDIDIFMLPSIFEGLPFSLLEAMSLGKPCIVSKCDGNNDVIDSNVNGYACMSIEQYADAINNLLTNSEQYIKIGTAAHQYVKKHHNMLVNIKQLESYYSSLVEVH